mmetsp:Transcript_8786/g.19133  ORF Transcript_8786/g.19133 Transcript_8786/m.19133 type:complete len:360 (-) Transcript_8786:392-1471(-)
MFSGVWKAGTQKLRNSLGDDHHGKHEGQFLNKHTSQESPTRSRNFGSCVVSKLKGGSRRPSGREYESDHETGASNIFAFDSTAQTSPENLHATTTQPQVQQPKGPSRSDTSAPTLKENLEQSSAEGSVHEDELTSPRFLIAAALSLFAQDDDDAAATPISSVISEPFAAADHTLGSYLSLDLFDYCNDQPPQDSQQAAVLEAICILQAVCDAFKLRQLSVLNVLYILETTAGHGIRLNKANYRSLLLTALLITIKEYKDCAVWTADLRVLFPSLDLSCLRHLEPILLVAIDFRVSKLSGHVERQRVASRLEKMRTTEEILRPSSRTGFILCRKLITWTRNYLDGIFQRSAAGMQGTSMQ